MINVQYSGLNADQTAPVLSGSILFAIKATQDHKQMREQMTKLVTGWTRINSCVDHDCSR